MKQFSMAIHCHAGSISIKYPLMAIQKQQRWSINNNIINGHPNNNSFNFALAGAYKKGAAQSGGEIREIFIRELQFNPNLPICELSLQAFCVESRKFRKLKI